MSTKTRDGLVAFKLLASNAKRNRPRCSYFKLAPKSHEFKRAMINLARQTSVSALKSCTKRRYRTAVYLLSFLKFFQTKVSRCSGIKRVIPALERMSENKNLSWSRPYPEWVRSFFYFAPHPCKTLRRRRRTKF